MISGVSAGSSSSSTARICFTFFGSTSVSSTRPTTNPVVSFGPSGTSTREPSRVASRSAAGMRYVKVSCTASGMAICAYSERPAKSQSQFRHHCFHVGPHVLLRGRIAEQIGGVVGRHHFHAVVFEPLPAHGGDGVRFFEKALQRET